MIWATTYSSASGRGHLWRGWGAQNWISECGRVANGNTLQQSEIIDRCKICERCEKLHVASERVEK